MNYYCKSTIATYTDITRGRSVSDLPLGVLHSRLDDQLHRFYLILSPTEAPPQWAAVSGCPR